MIVQSTTLSRARKSLALLSGPVLPYLALGVGILAFSFSGIFVRWAGVPGPVVGTYRYGLAAVVFLPALLKYRPQRTQTAKINPINPLLIPAIGGLFTALDYAVWSISLAYTSVGNAALLNDTAPLWVGLVAALVFREKLKRYYWPGLLMAVFGAFIVVSGDYITKISFAKGDILALVSSIFYAGYFVITQVGRMHLSTITYISMLNLSATVTLLGICALLGYPLFNYSLQTYLMLGLATLVSVIGGFTVSYSLGHVTASVVSPTMILKPILASILAFWLLGEAFSTFQIIGGLVALAGIFLVHLGKEGGA